MKLARLSRDKSRHVTQSLKGSIWLLLPPGKVALRIWLPSALTNGTGEHKQDTPQARGNSIHPSKGSQVPVKCTTNPTNFLIECNS